MIFRFLLLSFLAFPVLGAQQQVSISMLNNALKQNYSFVERSLNKSALKIEESSGKIYFDQSTMMVEILTPFKERYLLSGNTIEIYDLDLDQMRILGIEEIDSIFISVLVHGAQENSPKYDIQIVDLQTIELMPSDASSPVQFIFNSGALKLIRYTDKLEVEHGIELQLL